MSEDMQVLERTAPAPKTEQLKQAEIQMVKSMFESTVGFFRLINRTMIALGYSRQKRRQVWESLIKKSTLNDQDVIKGLLEELVPIMEEAKNKAAIT